MSEGKKATYARPKLTAYGDFATLTAAGSGQQTEVFPDNQGQNMMRRP